jgi:hypothetical protein
MAQPQTTNKNITPQERALLFNQATRQNLQMLPSQKVSGENTTVQFNLPKVRLLSRIWVEVDAIATLTSTAGTIARAEFSPYDILRRVSLDLNNGFSPFIVSGRDLYFYNLVKIDADTKFPNASLRANTYVENTATPAGNNQRIKFLVALPLTINDRDPVGLVLLQNEETNVNLTIDVDTLANAYALNAGNGDRVTFQSMTISPMIETFSIPTLPEAFPDISVLKLVNSKTATFGGNGQNIVKLSVGTIYRKLMFYFQHDNGTPFTVDEFRGNFELVFNQADIPYNVKPSILAALNQNQFGAVLPVGLFIVDFSNLDRTASRDLVDTERLTEFWLRFSTETSGKVTIVSETLSRLRQA